MGPPLKVSCKRLQVCLLEHGIGLYLVKNATDTSPVKRSLIGWCGPDAGGQPFKLLGRVMKAHARVIWACSWGPDDRSFVTGARDSLVKVWSLGSGREGMAGLLFGLLPFSSAGSPAASYRHARCAASYRLLVVTAHAKLWRKGKCKRKRKGVHDGES